MAMTKIIRRLRRILFWQMTVTEVRFITADGAQSYLHVHPAWHGEQRIFEDALYEALPGHMSYGKVERSE